MLCLQVGKASCIRGSYNRLLLLSAELEKLALQKRFNWVEKNIVSKVVEFR
jgi:hypothetical protein